MPVNCPAGYNHHSGPSTPVDSFTKQADGTFKRVTYEWELADNSTPPSCGCGQTATFNFGYGYTDEGGISIAPAGIGGGVAAGTTGYTELSVNVGPDDYEYVGLKIVLLETTEAGIVATQSGGLVGPNPTLWQRVKFAWNFAWNGPAALVPTVTYGQGTVTTRHTQAAWKICRKPCE